jgi:hypothetical protein
MLGASNVMKFVPYYVKEKSTVSKVESGGRIASPFERSVYQYFGKQ